MPPLIQYYKDKKFIGKGLGYAATSKTVFNVIRALVELPNNVVYLKNYNTSGIQRIDEHIAVSPFDRTLDLFSLAMSKERQNVYVFGAKLAKALPTAERPFIEDTQVYRAYHIIRDGKLHIPIIHCVLGSETYSLFHRTGIIDPETPYIPSHVYTVPLRKLPLISRSWANPRVLGLVDLLKEEEDLVSERTAFKKWGDVLKLRGQNILPPRQAGDNEWYTENPQYFKERNLVTKGEVSTYTASFVTVSLSNYTPTKYVDWDAIDLGEAPEPTFSYKEVLSNLQRIKKRLARVRFISRSILFAMEYKSSPIIAWDSGEISNRGLNKKMQTGWLDDVQLKRITWEKEVERTS
tara:strand:+ start:208 stop:1257 length:1050 start_codon:yes stop_codon:yes gene_type:complete